MSLPHERYCILDSDIVFFRDFDLSKFQVPNPIPPIGQGPRSLSPYRLNPIPAYVPEGSLEQVVAG